VLTLPLRMECCRVCSCLLFQEKPPPSHVGRWGLLFFFWRHKYRVDRAFIVLEISPEIQASLEKLVETGFYGVDVVACAEQLVRERLREVEQVAARRDAIQKARLQKARPR